MPPEDPMEPLLPNCGALPPQFHTVSSTRAPFGPAVVRVVPPTCMILVLSAGKGTPLMKALVSCEALKKDCPWAFICLKRFSAVVSRPPGVTLPHEQLNCAGELLLSLAMAEMILSKLAVTGA